MERVVTNEMSRFLFVLSMGVVGLMVLMVRMIDRLRGGFKPYQKATIVYLLASLLCFCIVAFASLLAGFSNLFSTFIFCQCCFLFYGVAHFRLMHHYLRWSGDQKSALHESLFTVIVALLGSVGFALVLRFFYKNNAAYTMTSGAIFFVIPFVFYHAFRKATAIPPKIVKQWFYPVNTQVEEPDENKLKNLAIISFEFQKKTGDNQFTNFRAKAPRDMEFGQLFYYFINDYNERHINDRIQFITDSGEPHGWIFYRKPRWFSFITDYKDAGKTIYINNIRENDVIICSRCTI